MLELVGAGRCGDVDRLPGALLELGEVEGPVVERRGQPEAVLDEHLLAGPVAAVHGANLGQGHVGLVDEEHVVLGEVVHQRVGGAAGLSLGQVARVVLDAGAVARLAQHLHVVAGPRLDALGLQQPALGPHVGQVPIELGLDVLDGKLELLVGRDEVLGGVYLHVVALAQQLAGEGVQLDDALDLVAPELDAHGHLVLVRGHDLQGVAAHAEVAPGHVVVVALVLHVDQLADQAAAAALLAPAHVGDEALVLLWRAQAEDAGDRRHDQHVAPGQQGPRGRVAQLVELLVDVGLLLDVGVGARHVRLGLVVVVVADEVLDGVAGEKFLELRRKLCGQVLLWAMTRVGRSRRSITPAMVKVLPLPVTPSRVW